jgi:hypothetical protein
VTLAPRPISDADALNSTAGPTASALPTGRSNFTQVKGNVADNVVEILSIKKTCKVRHHDLGSNPLLGQIQSCPTVFFGGVGGRPTTPLLFAWTIVNLGL